MTSPISVIIPAHNEASYITKCLESIAHSAEFAGFEPEVVVALNRCTDTTQAIAEGHGALCVAEERACIAAVRNTGIKASSGTHILTIDADSWMTQKTLWDARRTFDNPRFIGGGTLTLPERWSIGIVASVLSVAPYLVASGIFSAGMFWFDRDTFDQLGGFDEDLLSVEDLDFAVRLKALGRARGQRYGTIRKGYIKTSCRKFDHFGDWYLARNPKLVRKIFAGKDREATDGFYYKTGR